MATNYNDNNVYVTGTIMTEFEFSHSVRSKNFYFSKIAIKRRSGNEDIIPLLVSERLINEETIKGKLVNVTGQIRTHNRTGEDSKRHLDIYIFAKSISIYKAKEDDERNTVCFNGFVCRKPIFRVTPAGKIITEVLVAVNRPHSQSAYIPCITWGKVARWASNLKVGDEIRIREGRIQSREYFKRKSPGSEKGDYKETYEVSALKVELV